MQMLLVTAEMFDHSWTLVASDAAAWHAPPVTPHEVPWPFLLLLQVVPLPSEALLPMWWFRDPNPPVKCSVGVVSIHALLPPSVVPKPSTQPWHRTPVVRTPSTLPDAATSDAAPELLRLRWSWHRSGAGRQRPPLFAGERRCLTLAPKEMLGESWKNWKFIEKPWSV